MGCARTIRLVGPLRRATRFSVALLSGSLVFIFFFFLFATTSMSWAQDQSTTRDDALADAEVRVGIAAAEDDRWLDALEAFRRAYARSPKMTILVNLASAEARTGKLLDAAEHYRRVLAAPMSSEVTTSHRQAAGAALEGVERRIPHLRIVVPSPQATDHV